ncbi:MAG: hypothetical protein IRZ08_22110, partial [Frankia sp.]|nr:hypothetical protein [Frankia sp.]
MTGQPADGARAAPMASAGQELLVVLGPGTTGPPAPAELPEPPCDRPPEAGGPEPPAALDVLARLVEIEQAYPPRLALVRLPESMISRIAGEPYVVGVYAGPPPAAVIATLAPGERLFVDAWLARRRDARRPRHRRGEGLPWDAPGFEPPGPPDT